MFFFMQKYFWQGVDGSGESTGSNLPLCKLYIWVTTSKEDRNIWNIHCCLGLFYKRTVLIIKWYTTVHKESTPKRYIHFLIFVKFSFNGFLFVQYSFMKFEKSSRDCYKCSIHLVFHLRRQKSEKCGDLSSWGKFRPC